MGWRGTEREGGGGRQGRKREEMAEGREIERERGSHRQTGDGMDYDIEGEETVRDVTLLGRVFT